LDVAHHRWLIPTLAAVAVIAFLVAGVVVWRMSAPLYPLPPRCPANSLCYNPYPPFMHLLHPLEAECLWAASALLALVAVGVALLEWRRPSAVQPVGG
jgi:hypothetical protein